jgi:hypothetical protein
VGGGWPGEGDDAGYVFSSARSKSPLAGLGISPAVAKYLGFNQRGLTSWRFVDDRDVPPGMWLRYDEQSILLRALHAQAVQSK